MSGSITAGASPLAGIGQIISALSPIFLGGGKTTGTGTTAGTQTTGTVQQTGANPSVIAQLMSMFQQATSNANNPQAATKDTVDNIIKENINAFAPVIGNQASSGLYNGSTLNLLAGEAAARSAQQVASTVLNYQTSQQQIAAATGNDLINATKTLSTTGQTATNQNSGTTSQTAPVIGSSGGSNLLTGIGGIGGALLLKSILPSDPLGKIKSLIGGGDATSASDLLDSAGNYIVPPVPPDLASAVSNVTGGGLLEGGFNLAQ